MGINNKLMMQRLAICQGNSMVFNFQARMYQVHPRGYNDFTDMHYHLFHETNAALQGCHNVEDYAFVFEKYQDVLTDF